MFGGYVAVPFVYKDVEKQDVKTMFLLINLISNLFLNHILFEKNFNIKFIFQSHTI